MFRVDFKEKQLVIFDPFFKLFAGSTKKIPYEMIERIELPKGETKYDIVYLIDYDNIENNSFIVANQWTFVEGKSEKRPDVLVFLNGIPVVLIELKSPSREQTDASEAYTQIRNYIDKIPSMFIYNAMCVMSDMVVLKAGTITSGEDRFMAWKSIDGIEIYDEFAHFDIFFKGIFERNRFLDILKNFICFSSNGIDSHKILAGYVICKYRY